MKRICVSLLVLAAMCACHQPSTTQPPAIDSLPPASVDTLATFDDSAELEGMEPEKVNLPWLNSVVKNYIDKTDNRLIRLENKDSSRAEWYIDDVKGKFVIIPIGATVTEADGSQPRFTTMMWLHIDTATLQVYEYDLPNDTLIKWKGN